MASFKETFTSIFHTNYPSTQFGKPIGAKLTFVCQHSSLCFRQSVGGFGLQFHGDLYFNSKSGFKRRINVVGKASDSLQAVLDRYVSIAYETSSEFRSKFLKVLASPRRRLQEAIAPMEPTFSKLNEGIPVNFALGLGMVVVFMVIAIKGYVARQSGDNGRGSVSDLIKRGQLRSDRRAISRPLKYDDPFNNPLVRMGEKNSTVKICGKVFHLAPVTLTEEKVLSHQNRRVRAYQWKRPTVFLKEGDPVPAGVDPETVRWIPANHPFATASNEIDEEFAQKNIYQKQGVPSRLKAEHEALQRRMMEATQNGIRLAHINPNFSVSARKASLIIQQSILVAMET